ETAVRDENTTPLYFSPQAALQRLDKFGDLWAETLRLQQQLPAEFAAALPVTKTTRSGALKQYERKRDFAVTKEPPPVPKRSHQGSRRRFVIQKHAASHLHYDFRLEMSGVLKSWAVPKGPPYAVDERRLARETEDHPIAYLDFEGTIPKGQYGGGTVMVWDIGTYEINEGNYWKGKLRIHLDGKKLKGEFTIERTPDGKGNWTLIKSEKSMRPVSAKKDDQSALTGRSMAEIAEAKDRIWHSNRLNGTVLDKLP